MNKSELVVSIATKSGLNNKQAKAVVDGFIETIKETLAKGEAVSLIGFGSFELTSRRARIGRNPLNGEKIFIPAAVLPKFKVGKTLKNAIPQPE